MADPLPSPNKPQWLEVWPDADEDDESLFNFGDIVYGAPPPEPAQPRPGQPG